MKYSMNVAALLLLTAVAVNGQVSTGPSNTSPGPCVGGSGGSATYTWNQTDNTHFLGGQSTTDQTPETCKATCIANSNCSGIDWDPNNTGGQKCWLTFGGTKQPSTGVTHYDLTRTPGTGGSGSCPPVDCSVKWADPIANTNVNGGTQNGATSVDGCKAACEAISTCRGMDWDGNAGAASKCWLQLADGTLRTGLAGGVSHYSILSRPGSDCTTGCIFVAVDGTGVVTVDENDYLVFSDNLDDGVVWQQTSCLIPGADVYNGSCVSFTMSGEPNLYVRNYFGRLYLDTTSSSADSGISPTKFKEDASFTKPVAGGVFALGSPFGEDVYVGADGKNVAFVSTLYTDPVAFYCYPSQSDAVVIPGQCPNVWSRVDNARFDLSNTVIVSTNCRAKTISSGLAVGVSTSNCQVNGSCILLTSSSADDSLLPDYSYTHYDLWRKFPGTCNRGCTYTWQFIAPNVTYRLLNSYSNIASIYQCQKICIQSYKWTCVGVNYNSATSYCRILQSGSSFFQNNVWKLIPKYTGCGPCISSVGYLYEYSDPLAVPIQAPGSIQCLTACINNKKCIGYETRNGSNCYVSIISNSSLVYTQSTGSRITAVYKSPCGNGCVHKWDLIPGSKIEDGETTQNATTVTTETNCRFECINVPTCTGIDWFKDTKKCVLGINYPSVSHRPPPYTNVNHYELHRNDDCDCADGPCEGN